MDAFHWDGETADSCHGHGVMDMAKRRTHSIVICLKLVACVEKKTFIVNVLSDNLS